jgi:hypothetical protein
MIGHRMNGGTILAVAPAETADHHVVLHVAHYAEKTQYATGLVHYSQMPAPTEWWVGNYFDRLEQAVEDFLARATTDPTHFAAEIAKASDQVVGASNSVGVIRQAALHFLHGEDVSDAPASLSLTALADALGVPHEDVEAIL